MTRADDLALDAERMAKAETEAAGKHDEPGRDILAVRYRYCLAIGTRHDRRDFALHEFNV